MSIGHDSVTLTARVKNPVARRVKAHADLTGRTVSKMISDMLRAAYGGRHRMGSRTARR